MKKHILALLMLALGTSAWADNHGSEKDHASLTPNGVVMHHFMGLVDGNDFKSEGLYGLGLGYRFVKPFSVELSVHPTELETNTGTGDDEVDVGMLQLEGLYHFRSRGSFEPFVSIGLSHTTYESNTRDDTDTRLTGGAGINWNMTPKTSWRAAVKLFPGNPADNEVNSSITFGIHHVFGELDDRPRDSDRDGVPDSRDRCPDTPRRTLVDASGCPIDSDLEALATGDQDRVKINLNVEFDFDSSTLRRSEERDIRRVANFLKKYPRTDVTLEGHTDNVGDENYNLWLSERRAKTVADRLIERYNIERRRVSTVGHGETKPIATNATESGRQKNRRVTAEIETVLPQ